MSRYLVRHDPQESPLRPWRVIDGRTGLPVKSCETLDEAKMTADLYDRCEPPAKKPLPA